MNPAPTTTPASHDEFLHRPLDQRRREYKYRFAQTAVFGLPVLALQFWGEALSPVDAHRWVPILQSLLAGWILYVNAGLLIESLLTFPRLIPELLIALATLALYLYSIPSLIQISQPRFHIAVTLLLAWDALRWFTLSRATTEQLITNN